MFEVVEFCFQLAAAVLSLRDGIYQQLALTEECTDGGRLQTRPPRGMPAPAALYYRCRYCRVDRCRLSLVVGVATALAGWLLLLHD